jgi:hypothetical protein
MVLPTYYLVDKNGNVYNSIQTGFGGLRQRKEPKQIKSWANKNTGYHTVVLRNGIDKANCQYVHRLVAGAYLPNPLNLPEVNHNFYLTHEVKITKEPTENQKKALKFWGEDGVKID